MSIKLFNEDGTIVIRQVSDANITDTVPPMVYRLREHPITGEVYLVPDRPKFNLPEKCYGKHNTNKAQILSAFKKAEGATGVVLRGIKGAGKSALGEDLGNALIAMKMPVIMVDREVSRTALTLATKMTGPCMMYFDEFGKTFGEKSRRELLTYFSDTSFKKVLFVVTSNSKKELDKYMIDRPGRFLFMIDYKKLDPLAICEMIDDHELPPEMAQMLNAYVHTRTVTFDMLRFLMPIAKASKDYLEFNDHIDILNCPAPVFPHLTQTSVIYKGQPFYGYTRIIAEPGRKYQLELKVVSSPEPICVIDFDMNTRNQVMEESFFGVDRQFMLGNDVVLLARDEWGSSIQTVTNQHFSDPALAPSDDAENHRNPSVGMISMLSPYGDMAFRHGRSGMSDEQQKLLVLAQFIVDQKNETTLSIETADVAQ